MPCVPAGTAASPATGCCTGTAVFRRPSGRGPKTANGCCLKKRVCPSCRTAGWSSPDACGRNGQSRPPGGAVLPVPFFAPGRPFPSLFCRKHAACAHPAHAFPPCCQVCAGHFCQKKKARAHAAPGLLWCRRPGSNRHGCRHPRDFKSRASANFATPAIARFIVSAALHKVKKAAL